MSPAPPLHLRPPCSSTRVSVTASQPRGGECNEEASSFPRPPSPPSTPPSLCFGASHAPPVARWVAAAPLQPRRPRSACCIHRDERVLLEAQLVPPPGGAGTGNGGCDSVARNQHALNEDEPFRCRKLSALKRESVGDVRLSVLAEHCEPTRLALVSAISSLARDCKARQPDNTRLIGKDLLCLSAALQSPPRSRAPTPRVGPSRGPTPPAAINDGSGIGCPSDVQIPLPSTEVTQRSRGTATRGASVETPGNLGSTVSSRRPLKPSPPASAAGRVVGPSDRPSRTGRNARRIAHKSGCGGLGCDDMPKRASPVRRTGVPRADTSASDVSTVTSVKTVDSTNLIKSTTALVREDRGAGGSSKGGEGVSGSVAVVGSVGTGGGCGEVVPSTISQLAHVSPGSRQTLWKLAVQMKIPMDVLKVAWRIFVKYAKPGKGCESKSKEGSVGGAGDWSSVRPKVASELLEDGCLDAKGFAEALRELVTTETADALPESMLHNFFQTADVNGSGSLEFVEFALWHSRYGFSEDMLLTEEQKTLRTIARTHGMSIGEVERFKRAFDTYDIDGSGVIEIVEFGQLMNFLLKIPTHLELPRSRVRQFWTEADSDNSGAVEFAEFLVFYRKYFDVDPVDGLEQFYKMRTLRPHQ
eukprot:TRINITY_DN30240_c0_g1_i1.p1 TRINITY_DN30240_c0_g1~~TRINITY_DN30240_c0_g1_i1.p1  ORF type:complete len:676 (-),score=103.60 TRINITY_DN30240_c0_g1_i1:68-1996(-)